MNKILFLAVGMIIGKENNQLVSTYIVENPDKMKFNESKFYKESGVVTIFAKSKNIANTFVFLSFETQG